VHRINHQYPSRARIDPQSVLGYNIVVIAELTTLPMEFPFFRKQEKQHAFSNECSQRTCDGMTSSIEALLAKARESIAVAQVLIKE
jgi:hypothetical protein